MNLWQFCHPKTCFHLVDFEGSKMPLKKLQPSLPKRKLKERPLKCGAFFEVWKSNCCLKNLRMTTGRPQESFLVFLFETALFWWPDLKIFHRRPIPRKLLFKHAVSTRPKYPCRRYAVEGSKLLQNEPQSCYLKMIQRKTTFQLRFKME